MWNKLSQALVFKLFLSYLVVLLIGAMVLGLVVEIVIPSAFQRHMLSMPSMMGDMMERMDMFSSFRSGVNEALIIAAASATLAALAVSVWMSRRVVAPLQELTRASLRIAAGHFDQRVKVLGNDPDQYDELAQLGHAFNQMAEQLENTEQMRSQLLGDVSHELRTPLTTIKGSMQALVDGVLPATPATFEQIEQEADRLQRLVNDLQELSRVEAGAYELDREPLQIAELMETAAESVNAQYQQKGVALIHQWPAGLPVVHGDPDRLLQVLINLLSNACQYTPPGGEVRLMAQAEKNEVVISVIDNGIGIPQEHLPHLFTRFYRVDKSRSRQLGGGSGVGLTITRHLVEAHGGRIWAESMGTGKGSTFTFALPV